MHCHTVEAIIRVANLTISKKLPSMNKSRSDFQSSGGIVALLTTSGSSQTRKVINNSSFCSPWLGSTKRPPGTNKNPEKA